MEPEQLLYRHVFYHADRGASLKEGQEILLNENQLSYFGKAYWPAIQTKRFEDMNPMEQREFLLEQIKRESRYSLYASRMQAIFAANTIHEAIVFATSIIPKPPYSIPIIEIYADRFWTLDSNWLDYTDDSMRQKYYRNYWDGRISNHCPGQGERRPPRLEVMIALPVITGKVVHIVP
jgi:hypothetical protein